MVIIKVVVCTDKSRIDTMVVVCSEMSKMDIMAIAYYPPEVRRGKYY